MFIGLSAGTARAQAAPGFSIQRYEPSAAGEWGFAVDHPWYTSTRDFAGGLTFDYAHNPLLYGLRNPDGTFTSQGSAIEHQFFAHADVAASLVDRVNFVLSIPVLLIERGDTREGINQPGSLGVGDLRLGALIRLWGHSDVDPISIHVGGNVWFPTGDSHSLIGDTGFRGSARLILAGLAVHHLRWSFTGGFEYRPDQSVGAGPAVAGNSVGTELQFGALLQYADLEKRFAIGPEMTLATVVTNGSAFDKDYTALELLLGAQYLTKPGIQVGLAGGVGILREPGTPDFRLLLRVAYAPLREKAAPPPPPDRDHDGIIDAEDACPDTPGVRSSDPKLNGCPPPPPPPPDRDHDGVLDPDDQCPDTPQGDHPDPAMKGCPAADTDSDGVFDYEDKCPTVPQGDHPDPLRKGCPAIDSDGDGVYDYEDKCPLEPAGAHPDTSPDRLGCPLPDRDHDTVPDNVDACPDKPGAPSTDPKKNGCPGLVEVKNGQIVILQPVFFATDKDTILPKSFPVLKAVAEALKVNTEIKKLSIEGHTDNKGKAAHNKDLSERRAKSVVKYLVSQGIGEDRLEAHGFGDERPVADNKTNKGRAANRRVEFHIVDGGGAMPQGAAPTQPAPATPAQPEQQPSK